MDVKENKASAKAGAAKIIFAVKDSYQDGAAENRAIREGLEAAGWNTWITPWTPWTRLIS